MRRLSPPCQRCQRARCTQVHGGGDCAAPVRCGTRALCADRALAAVLLGTLPVDVLAGHCGRVPPRVPLSRSRRLRWVGTAHFRIDMIGAYSTRATVRDARGHLAWHRAVYALSGLPVGPVPTDAQPCIGCSAHRRQDFGDRSQGKKRPASLHWVVGPVPVQLRTAVPMQMWERLSPVPM